MCACVRGGMCVCVSSYFADAVSGNHILERTHFEDLHTYRLDWQPGGEGKKGYIRWFLDDVLLYGIDDDTLVSLLRFAVLL